MLFRPERVSFGEGQPALGLRRPVASAIAVAIVYFLAARLGLALLEKPDGVAVFWPAAGIASGLLIAFGSGARWPVIAGVMAATIGANLQGDRNIPTSILFAVANAAEAALIAGLIHKFFGTPFELNSSRRVLGLFVATGVGTTISGIIGTLGFILFYGSAAPIPIVWLHWFTSDALGTITLAPLVIGIVSLVSESPPKREYMEGALALTVIFALCALVVFLENQPWTLELTIASLCPLLLWIAARLRPVFTAAAVFIWAITIVWTTTFGIGMFGDANLPIEQRIMTAQATILATALGALVLAALFSERKLHEAKLFESETRLQEALRAGGVVAFEWDVHTDKIRYSRNVSQIGGGRAEQVTSRTEVYSQVHPDDLPHLKAQASNVRPDRPSYSTLFRYRRPNGEIWLEQVATAEFDSNGNITRVRGLATDVSERKRFEDEISRAQRSAELADRAKSAFLAAASHDLRQPLQTLNLLQAAFEQHHPDGEGRKLVDEMARSLEMMSSMLSSLLDINRLESGSLRPETSDFTVSEIFKSVATDFHPLAKEKGLQWRLVTSEVTIHSDKRMLEQMIRNLLSNAIRYTDHGKIVLGCRRAGDKIRIEVWDSGVGISGDQLPHIFDEYYQGRLSSERGGFGLGLAIVQRLGKMLQHRVDVRSTAGKGTRFSIEVPLGQRHAAATELARTLDRDTYQFDGNILIIEDEMSVRVALHRLLKSKGIGAVTVANGNDAMVLINQQVTNPDLLLTDYNLPGPMDGVETIRAMRAILGWNVPAIVMTGDTRSKTTELAETNDISVLIKPFVADELLSLINRLQQGSASQNPLVRTNDQIQSA